MLRHSPETIGITLDENGWTDVQVLLSKAAANGQHISTSDLDALVNDGPKKRFVFSDDKRRIRAAQGHSVKVDLNLELRQPPSILYHGTATRFLDKILEEGLKTGARNHVHLSKDIETALSVGSRHGKVVILQLEIENLVKAGQKFWLADNGVWLTDPVPPQYLAVCQ